MGQMTDGGGGEHTANPAFDPELHYEEEEEEEGEELGDTLKASETSSIFSDDSVYPCYTPVPCSGDQGELTLHQCCARNCAALLRDKLESGVTRQEAVQLDANGRVSTPELPAMGHTQALGIPCPGLGVHRSWGESSSSMS